jgi:hypothetical protein
MCGMPRREGDEDLLRPAPSQGGRTLLSIMWEDLMACIRDLMDKDSLDLTDDNPELNRRKGRAEGVAWCIAVLTHSPRTPDINLIKAEAMERWEAEEADR